MREFGREEFGLRHRYAMVLHTDEPHPHVHMIVKAMSEQGARLHIRKETLRRWRAEFAQRLRTFGVPANATDREVRAASRAQWKDSIFRAAGRGESRFLKAKAARGASTRLASFTDDGAVASVSNTGRRGARVVCGRRYVESGGATESRVSYRKLCCANAGGTI